MVQKVVIIGGSYAGAKAAKYFLEKGNKELQITVVSLTTHAFFTVAAPRLIAEPSSLDKAVFDIEKSLKKLDRSSQFSFIHGTVVSTNFDDNSIDLETDGKKEVLKYDILVVASGARYADPTFKLVDNHSSTVKSIEQISADLKHASKIAIVGGGPTGVETAGEIGQLYGNSKSITLYTGSDGPLAHLGDHRSKQATLKLEKLNVKVVNSVRGSTKDGKLLKFKDGSVESFDLIIQANGLKPNSSFLPSTLLDESGFLQTNEFLQLKDYPNVVALGDIVSGTNSDLVSLKMVQGPTFEKTIDYLLDKGQDKRKPLKSIKTTQLVPISHNGGIGVLFGFGIPNFMVRMIKAKDFMLSKAAENF